MFTALRIKRVGDAESWSLVAMFPGDVDVDELRAAINYGGIGPGESFAHPPAIVKKGKFVFVHQSGGLDI